jgi:hypothetical protein
LFPISVAYPCYFYFQEISIFEIVLEQNNRNLNKIHVPCLKQTSQARFSSNLFKLFGTIKHIHKRVDRIQILTLKVMSGHLQVAPGKSALKICWLVDWVDFQDHSVFQLSLTGTLYQ